MSHELITHIKILWREFDPIGVYVPGSEWSDDEYDSYIMPTYELLKKNASSQEIELYILYIAIRHMELEVNRKQIALFVEKLQALSKSKM
jgi:hypothetical protein